MKLLQILNEIEVVRNERPYTIIVPIFDEDTWEVIGNRKVLVAPEDLKQKMNWHEAKEACKELGPEWRLPTLEELKAMYEQLHKQGKGNFKDRAYWSSSETNWDGAWDVDFRNNGDTGRSGVKYVGLQIRPVRSLDSTIQQYEAT